MMFDNPTQIALAYVLFAWSLVWKGIALWRASHFKQRYWFIAMLVLNTVGILEIVYLFRFAKERMRIEELKFWEQHKKPAK